MTPGVLVAGLLFLGGVCLLWQPAGLRSRITNTLSTNDAETARFSGPGTTRSGATDGVHRGRFRPAPELSAESRGPVSAMVRAIAERRRNVSVEAAEWVVWMRQLAALLRVGRTAASAFDVAADSLAETPNPSATGRRMEAVCSAVAGGALVGRAPSTTLRSLATNPAARQRILRRIEMTVLTDLARCWEVSERTGAPLATLLEGLAEATEADLDAAAARDTALAGSRATVRILSWLPVMALGLGMLIGADPLRTLLTTPWGMAAGLVGAVLTIVGRVWTGRMVQAAERATNHSGTSRAMSRAGGSNREVAR